VHITQKTMSCEWMQSWIWLGLLGWLSLASYIAIQLMKNRWHYVLVAWSISVNKKKKIMPQKSRSTYVPYALHWQTYTRYSMVLVGKYDFEAPAQCYLEVRWR
jgi:hypothetical protein